MSDLRQRYHRILKQRGINTALVSKAADALVDAVEERISMEMLQVASNWQSHLRLKEEVKKLTKEESA